MKVFFLACLFPYPLPSFCAKQIHLESTVETWRCSRLSVSVVSNNLRQKSKKRKFPPSQSLFSIAKGPRRGRKLLDDEHSTQILYAYISQVGSLDSYPCQIVKRHLSHQCLWKPGWEPGFQSKWQHHGALPCPCRGGFKGNLLETQDFHHCSEMRPTTLHCH